METTPISPDNPTPWFTINGDWLHVANKRIRLQCVISYALMGYDVEISYGSRPQDSITLYGLNSAGVEWGGPAKELIAALDTYFANHAG